MPSCPLLIRFCAALITTSLATPVIAQGDEPEFPFPTTEFEEDAKSAAVTAGPVTARLTQTLRPEYDETLETPVLQVMIEGRMVLEVPGAASGMAFVAAEASIAEIDPENELEEIYFSSYSGGAHCCNEVVVAEEVDGAWIAVSIGSFDGDGNYLRDLDNDGLAEIVTVDNRFLYAFDCYACSAAPLTITTVRGGQAIDLSEDPRFHDAHREWLRQIEGNIEQSERWTSKGYLAGWIAAKIRVGEGLDAWREFSQNWDHDGDIPEETCRIAEQLDDCPRQDRMTLKFPERLKLFLDQSGYKF